MKRTKRNYLTRTGINLDATDTQTHIDLNTPMTAHYSTAKTTATTQTMKSITNNRTRTHTHEHEQNANEHRMHTINKFLMTIVRLGITTCHLDYTCCYCQ